MPCHLSCVYEYIHGCYIFCAVSFKLLSHTKLNSNRQRECWIHQLCQLFERKLLCCKRNSKLKCRFLVSRNKRIEIVDGGAHAISSAVIHKRCIRNTKHPLAAFYFWHTAEMGRKEQGRKFALCLASRKIAGMRISTFAMFTLKHFVNVLIPLEHAAKMFSKQNLGVLCAIGLPITSAFFMSVQVISHVPRACVSQPSTITMDPTEWVKMTRVRSLRERNSAHSVCLFIILCATWAKGASFHAPFGNWWYFNFP